MFTLFYRLLLGDFNQYDELEVVNSYYLWIGMLIFTLLLVIVLLNLLISIISDSFGKVFNLKTQTRTYELLNLINSIDRLLPNRIRDQLRNDKKIGNYLFVFYTDEEEKEFDPNFENHEKLLKLESSISQLYEEFKKNESLTNNNLIKIYERLEALGKN